MLNMKTLCHFQRGHSSSSKHENVFDMKRFAEKGYIASQPTRDNIEEQCKSNEKRLLTIYSIPGLVAFGQDL